MLNFPARLFIDFFDRHGFLNVDNRPRWRAINRVVRANMQKNWSSLLLRAFD